MTLTEQWKNGELEDGTYWVMLDVSGDGKIMQTPLSISNGKPIGWCKKSIKEVLAPVPSYEEWKKLSKQRNQLIRDVKDLAYIQEENRQLKTQIAKLTEIVGVLPSNHSVGNLGYKIKNQRHEINNRLKEIDKLKELLKKCRDYLKDDSPLSMASEIAKINNAIGEKK